ncbi:MAG: SpoIID/LytB domain-containing protein [Cyanobacteria bacterium P01_F01_bin.33]
MSLRSCVKFAIAISICWLWLSPAALAAVVRIAIARDADELLVGSTSAARLGDRQGLILQELAGNETAEIAMDGDTLKAGETTSSTQLVLQPTDPNGSILVNGKTYRGSLSLYPDEEGILAVNHVDLEQYVSSVVGGEVGSGFEFEAMKAQAVASRTYVLHHQQRRLRERFDVGHTAAAQVYRGIADESQRTQAAAQETRSEVLTYQGRLIDAVFHASSGGATENVEDIWGYALPYLRSVRDNWQEALQPWTQRISLEDLADFADRAEVAADVGDIKSLEVVQKTSTGRVTAVALRGDKGKTELSAVEFAAHFKLKSTLFSLDADENDEILIDGKGWGHGVGLSQWGAFGLAKQGWTYRQILAYYFQDVNLTTISGS